MKALENVVSITANIKYANYLLLKLKLLDKIVPILLANSNPNGITGQGDITALDKCITILASCSYQQWEDRTKSQLLLTYPHLIERLVAIFLHSDGGPHVQWNAARALWNLSYRTDEVKNSSHARALVPRLIDNLTCKHPKLKLFSIGLLWALCDNNKVTCAEVGKRDGMKILVQCLNLRETPSTEIYFLLISLANTLINCDTTQLICKKEALTHHISIILQPLLYRTTSTTLMDRLCDVLTSVLYAQTNEQVLFTNTGTPLNGVQVLVNAICNRDLRKCICKLSLALLAVIYRNPLWTGSGLPPKPTPEQIQQATSKMESLESIIQPAFERLCEILVEEEDTNPCSIECISVSLCLACLAQGKPRLQRTLLSRDMIKNLAMLLVPPMYAENDRVRVMGIGVGIIHQLAHQNSEIQRYLMTQSPQRTKPNMKVVPLIYAVKVDPTNNPANYGVYFKCLLDCLAFPKLRVSVCKTIICIAESSRTLTNLLLHDHVGFRSSVIGEIKSAAPYQRSAELAAGVKPQINMQALLQLVSCFHVLTGGAALSNSSTKTPAEAETVLANLTMVTQLILEDRHLSQAFMAAHSFGLAQIQKQQQLMQQQQQQQQQQQTHSSSTSGSQSSSGLPASAAQAQAQSHQQSQQQSLHSHVNAAVHTLKSSPSRGGNGPLPPPPSTAASVGQSNNGPSAGAIRNMNFPTNSMHSHSQPSQSQHQPSQLSLQQVQQRLHQQQQQQQRSTPNTYGNVGLPNNALPPGVNPFLQPFVQTPNVGFTQAQVQQAMQLHAAYLKRT